MKKGKGAPNSHTSNGQFGRGDWYGQALKQPMGKMRSDSITGPQLDSKNLGKTPKDLA